MATPFFTSHTPIAQMDTRLAGSIGDRFGAGIQQGVQQFMAGVEQKRMKDEKKQQDEAALQFAVKAAPMLGLDPNDTESLKAGIKGMGGGAQFLKFAQGVQEMAQEAEHNRFLQEQYAAQSEAMRFATARKMKSDAAIAESFDPTAKAKNQIRGGAQFGEIDFSPPTPEESMQMALRGGADPRALAEAAEMFASGVNKDPRKIMLGDTPVIVGHGGQFQVDPVELAKLGTDKKYKPHEVKELLANLASAEKAGDERAAQFYRAALEKATTASGGGGYLDFMNENEGVPSPAVPDNAKPKGPPPRPKGMPDGYNWNESKQRWEKR